MSTIAISSGALKNKMNCPTIVAENSLRDINQSRVAFRKQCGVYRSVKPNQDLGI